MMLADMGAEVIRIDRRASAAGKDQARFDVTARGRRSLGIDLKKPGGADTVLRLIDQADILIEGFRPGVMERLGLGPEVCQARNPRLVYGRMTGWGQHGPLANAAGHDINYIALTGALHAIGRPGEPPVVPLNYIGDFGGGAMFLAFGVVCAVLEAQRSGRGQVVDAAMTDGAALLSAMMYGMKAAGKWSNQRGENLLDGGAHFYGTYACADGKYVAIGSIEPKFYDELLQRLGLQGQDLPKQNDRKGWPTLRKLFAGKFLEKSRDEWCTVFEGSDACFAPVLTFSEARAHPHNVARRAYTYASKVDQPSPAPRFSRTPGAIRGAPPERGAGGRQALLDWGFSEQQIASLKERGLGIA